MTTKTTTLWVLLYAHNSYNQHGEYFMAAFCEKPSPEQLRDVMIQGEYPLDVTDDLINHVLSGGGRKNSEDMWHYLIAIDSGKYYLPVEEQAP